MNKLILVGRAGSDCELKYSPKGVPVGTFSLAVDDGKDAEGKKITQWFNITCFKKTAEFLSGINGGLKGCLLVVDAKLVNNNYVNADGKKVYQNSILVQQVEVKTYANASPSNGNQSQASNQDDGLDDEALLNQLGGR